MSRGDVSTALLIGRWQRPHRGHAELVKEARSMGFSVVIGIRVSRKSRDNPYSYWYRWVLLKWMLGLRTPIIRVPDPGSDLTVVVGRDVGYEVVRLDEEIERISGKVIREKLRAEGKLK